MAAATKRRRHAAPVSAGQMSAELAMLVLVAIVTGTVLVSGWYAAAAAAGLVTP